MKRLRTSTCWSGSGSNSVCARIKLAAVGIPLGREASRISRLEISDIIIIPVILSRSSRGYHSSFIGTFSSIPDGDEKSSADGEQCKLKPGGWPADQIQAIEEGNQTARKSRQNSARIVTCFLKVARAGAFH